VADSIAFAAFVLFLVAGAAAARAERDPARGPRRALAFVAVTVLAALAAGVSQRDLWPFSRWNFAAAAAAPRVTVVRIVAVDDAGAEHLVDPRALEPLPFDELRAWLLAELPRLPPAARDRLADDLLSRAEASRARAAGGGPVGLSRRVLGPLAAPSFVVHPRQWADGSPPRPFRGLRVYVESWDQEALRRHGPRAIERRLLHERAR